MNDERECWAGDVARALDGLGATQRSVVVMAYFQRMTLESIAERLSISVRQVRADLAEGLARVAQAVSGGSAASVT